MKITASLCLIAISGPAWAQSYDPENKWIGRSIRQQLHADHDHTPSRPRVRVEYRDRWHREPKREHSSHHPETRVYGVAIRRYDATGSVGCYPPVEAYSVEANTEDGAWTDAQRNWENQTRAMVGERWMEVRNARDIEKQCWASSGNQSVAGRVSEKVGAALQTITGNEGGIDGRKHRCRISARPCQAPKEIDPTTKGNPNDPR